MTAIAWSFVLAGGAVAAGAPAEALRLTADCEVRFATVDQGREILTADDAFTAQLSQFDLQCRLKTDKDVTVADWKQFVAQHVRAWSPEEITAVSQSIERLRKLLTGVRLPLPLVIQLV